MTIFRRISTNHDEKRSNEHTNHGTFAPPLSFILVGGGYRFTKMTFLHIFLQIPLLWSTRSYAALRAADLDWIVGLEYSSGRYILGCSQRLASCLRHSARTDILFRTFFVLFLDDIMLRRENLPPDAKISPKKLKISPQMLKISPQT